METIFKIVFAISIISFLFAICGIINGQIVYKNTWDNGVSEGRCIERGGIFYSTKDGYRCSVK